MTDTTSSTGEQLDTGSVYLDKMGICSIAACAPVAMTSEDVAAAVNAKQPTGIESPWVVSDEPPPVPCDVEPGARRHYALHC